jgi:hypothetical protein
MGELSPSVDLPVCPFQLSEFSFTFTYARMCILSTSMQRKTTKAVRDFRKMDIYIVGPWYIFHPKTHLQSALYHPSKSSGTDQHI